MLNRKQEAIFLGRRRLLGVLGFAGVGLVSGFGFETTQPRARADEENKASEEKKSGPNSTSVRRLMTSTS